MNGAICKQGITVRAQLHVHSQRKECTLAIIFIIQRELGNQKVQD